MASVPTTEATAAVRAGAPPQASRPTRRGWASGGRLLVLLSALALVIAAFSLLIPSTPSYDPWAWLVWGREIIHVNLHTTGGPSWKPLPMIFTTIFALFGRAQPDLWLVIARAGALMAAVMVFRVAWRLTRALTPAWTGAERRGALRALAGVAPLLAGAIATLSLLNSPGFVSDNALGYSEGLATALMLASVDRFMDGRRRTAFVLGFFASLDRPELWVFWIPYGLYLFWRDAGARRLVIALFVLIPALWFLPELWGSGHLFRGVTRALHPRSNSAAFASCPVCTVFKQEAWPALLNRVKIPAILAVLAALWGLWRTRSSWWRRTTVARPVKARALVAAVGAFGFVWWAGIAIETQLGFSGNERYLVLGTAPVAIAGGVAWGWLALGVAALGRSLAARIASASRLASAPLQLLSGAIVAVGLFLAVPPWIAANVISIPRTHAALVYQAHLREDLAAIVHRYGARGLLHCGNGTVMTEGFQVPMVAWYLGVRTLRVEDEPELPEAPAPWPSVILQTRDTRSAALLPLWQTIAHWQQLGARYRISDHRTFRLFMDCRTA
jgi:hypothetical protein